MRPDYYGLGSQRGRAKRRAGWRGSMRLGALFAVLVGINVYVFFFRGGTSIHDVLKTSSIARKNVALAAKGSAKSSAVAKDAEKAQIPSDDSVIIQGTMKGFVGLSGALAARKIEQPQINELIAALGSELNMRGLRPEQSFEVRLDPKDGRIRRFIFRTSAISTVEVVRASGGGLKARKQESALTTKVARVGGRIESSLIRAITKSGESAALVSMFVDLFSWDINWYNDPREGDEFRIVVEKQYLGETFHRYGPILAAEYRGKVGRFQAFYFKPAGGTGGYFIPEGRSLRRTFLKTPLNFRRLSSKYNTKRVHPVLHTTKGHYGVDYAAGVGTPVWAAADGVVASAARSGGAGNMVVLNHAAGVSTVYMHLSRFARGLKAGQKVKQRQVIGNVGSTGLSTGPHLHYGIKVRGRYVDPLVFKVSKGEMLARADRIRFLDQLPDRMSALEAIPIQATAAAPAEKDAEE
jgi:murein DD-endopeptidase MepM/ murein hydrolase activator NlpD